MSLHRAGIRWNATKPQTLSTALALCGILEEHGVSCACCSRLAEAAGRGDGTDDFRDCDVLFVLGGDGTILSSVKDSLQYDIPILGINIGHVGFLTDAGPEDMEDAVLRVLRGDYDEKSLMLLECTGPAYALNEFVWTARRSGRKVAKCDLYIDGAFCDTIEGDGLIVATPAGSTGYSLSAGGSIVYPELDCILLTPVSSRRLGMRPLVLPPDSTVRLVPCQDPDEFEWIADGMTAYPMPECGMTVKRCGMRARFICLRDRDFFAKLRGKLTENHKC